MHIVYFSFLFSSFILFIYYLLKIVFFETGTDVAGEVVQVGSGVKNVKAGDKVVAMLSFVVKFSYLFIWFCQY